MLIFNADKFSTIILKIVLYQEMKVKSHSPTFLLMVIPCLITYLLKASYDRHVLKFNGKWGLFSRLDLIWLG